MEDYIIIRPMYKTDPGYRKGMKVAILKSTGEIIKKHYDNVGIHIPEMYNDLPHKLLMYDEVDWELAGYMTTKAKKDPDPVYESDDGEEEEEVEEDEWKDWE